MSRTGCLVLATLLTGCSTRGLAVSDAHFPALTEREVVVVVRVANASGDYPRLNVDTSVVGSDIAWASLARDGADGVIRRGDGGPIELSTWEYLSPESCAEATCELQYVVTLDVVPEDPWDLVVSASVDSEDVERVTIEIVTR